MDEIYRINREIVREFFENNFSTHTDWYGTRLATQYECNNIEELTTRFMDYVEENNCD